jgi:hypothetical protein
VSKPFRILFLLATLAVPIISFAADAYQHATIVAVEKRAPATTYFHDSPSEAPLAANRVSYDISVQMQCTIYVGRYRSEMNYLPAEFVVNHPVDIRLLKNVMYVSVPGSNDLKMGIVRRRHLVTNDCNH